MDFIEKHLGKLFAVWALIVLAFYVAILGGLAWLAYDLLAHFNII